MQRTEIPLLVRDPPPERSADAGSKRDDPLLRLRPEIERPGGAKDRGDEGARRDGRRDGGGSALEKFADPAENPA
jgi:hypothetical protein